MSVFQGLAMKPDGFAFSLKILIKLFLIFNKTLKYPTQRQQLSGVCRERVRGWRNECVMTKKKATRDAAVEKGFEKESFGHYQFPHDSHKKSRRRRPAPLVTITPPGVAGKSSGTLTSGQLDK
ncbi:hypothetical protein EVAR_94055_1 [Eumeta japonica]|uniref:Uncharacterized protein n=1 Tax=Eumeta variegata TaxID=151549 RepID=A0A4C1V6W3_EUMVA|nr:hypothetical protein EVAR_94055_1 [Eumeta japonica]